ncbi:uncharacterized protein LOC107045152 [Diachasma alloeum]|uniref:uncharacterized protein LOC107045152 n=1 Tax=Diachasma alloeum TaxID=454923 RepID=UPI00073823F6|nr:uncharacterized protein LOC107045152 [Diachasma alloeum]
MSLRRNSSMDSSTGGDDLNGPMSKLTSMIRQSKKVFVGNYTERRYVQSVPAYRDIVSIDPEESEVVNCLTEIQKVVREEFREEKWLGITCNMVDNIVVNYNLWVELDKVPLGKHWFQIRSLKVNQNTIQLQLRYLRPYEGRGRDSFFNESAEFPSFNIKQILTYHNVCEVAKFSAVLIMSIITVTGNLLWYISEYSLRLTRELSNLIRVLTPIIFGLYEFMTKCVGGFMWLIYMLFSGNSAPRNPPPMAIMGSSPRPLQYRRSYSNQKFRY